MAVPLRVPIGSKGCARVRPTKPTWLKDRTRRSYPETFLRERAKKGRVKRSRMMWHYDVHHAGLLLTRMVGTQPHRPRHLAQKHEEKAKVKTLGKDKRISGFLIPLQIH